jgi:hypothetical protein
VNERKDKQPAPQKIFLPCDRCSRVDMLNWHGRGLLCPLCLHGVTEQGKP